ncbi:MAG: cell division protein ZapE [Steroidobacteraceae bacterium]
MDAPATAPSVRELYAQQAAERGFQPDSAQLAAVARLDELRARLLAASAQPEPRWPRWPRALGGRGPLRPERGLYLWGEVGRGKTWLMDLLVESLPGAGVRRRHFHRFMHDTHAALRELRRRADPLDLVAARLARDTRVLCFDELAVSDIADAMILGGLLAALFRRGVALVATSNVAPRNLYRDGLQRQRFLPAIELIERHVEVFEVAGAVDYRLRHLTNAGVYLDAGAPDTARRLRALFDALDSRSAADGSIDVEGRPIAVVRRSHAAAWFDFAAVCATPRSAADYIEIAREFATLVVENVPRFDALHEDEARRFVALVDELYDRGVNLIVSAAAAPADLYRGERLAAQFRRTASRLVEMQSAEYLAREHRA